MDVDAAAMAGVVAGTAGGVEVVAQKGRQVTGAHDALDQHDHRLVLGDRGGPVVVGAPAVPVIVVVLGPGTGDLAVEAVVTCTSERGAQWPVPGGPCGVARFPGQQ